MARLTVDGRSSRVPNPGFLPRGSKRGLIVAFSAAALIFAVPTVNGTVQVANGNLGALPLAVGGALGEVALLVFLAVAFGVEAGVAGDTASRHAVTRRRRAMSIVQWTALAAMAVGVLYGAVRAVQGDNLTIVCAVLSWITLWPVSASARRQRDVCERSLSAG